MRWLRLQRWGLRRLDALATRRRVGRPAAGHLATGERGEREALFHLRGLGYTVVARRWRTVRLRGDVDLIAWEGEWLCFVEVKTRTGRNAMEPAEAAVDTSKQTMLRKMAKVYLQGFPEELRRKIRVRFDVVSVYLKAEADLGIVGKRSGDPEFEVWRGAFGWE